jgi:hypothetical protein
MQVYCVLCVSAERSSGGSVAVLARPCRPWIFRGENVIKPECRVQEREAKGKFERAATELTTGACSAADSLCVGDAGAARRQRLDSAEPFAG